MDKVGKKNVCAEFCARFPSHRSADIPNSERVRFMLNHPLIRSKLNEWIGVDNNLSTVVSLHNGINKKKTNVNSQFIETDGPDITELTVSPTLTEGTHSQPMVNRYLKNPSHSLKQRELGNNFFKERNLYESLQAYNEAIRFAPFNQDDSETTKTSPDAPEKEFLSLSFANRSAVYFELGEHFYEKSLIDVDLALKYGYPDRLKNKLLLRKANIYVKTKKWSRAESIIEEIRKSDDATNKHLHPDGITKMQELANEIQEQLKNGQSSSDGHDVLVDETKCLADCFEENENFENASAGVNIGYSEDVQRFVVADMDLKKRDIIFYETPFASVLLPSFYESHCNDCNKMLENSHFIPCQQCSQCLLNSIGIAHLAMRIVLCAGLQNICNAIQNHKELVDPKNISVFRKGYSNYERVYSLLDHIQDMNLQDVFQYTLTAGLLTNWLVNKTSFFDGRKETCQEGNYSAIQIEVGGSILRHICQLICNAHAITDILSDINVDKISLSTVDETQRRISTAIFPAASIMNHSCDPNIAFTFKNGKTLLVKLTKDISKGHEIFNCYGPHRMRMAVSVRQESLNDQYFFQCKCDNCKEELAQGISFVDTFSSFKCEDCAGPVISPGMNENQRTLSFCQSCGHEMDLHDQILACVYTDRLFQDAEVLLERGQVSQALAMFHTCEEQYRGFLYEYHSSFGQLADIIGRCYAVLGEFSKAADFVKKSLVYVEKKFNAESIEYGREVKKYVDLRSQSQVVDADDLKRFSELYKSILSEYY